MAYRFVDSTTGSDSDTGADFDLAWATKKYAWESGGLSPGDFVFTRPNHSETPTTDIVPAYSGDDDNPIKIVAWPKPAFSITSATWTNGSTTVDNVLPASLTRSGFVGRMITAPDGNDYFITYITDSNTFILRQEYAGATVSGVSGAATIKADEYYTEAQAIDDSATTIKKTDWDANNPARPIIDFNDTDYQLFLDSDDFYRIHGFEFKDSADGVGIVAVRLSRNVLFQGCVFKQTTSNAPCIGREQSDLNLVECIIEGAGTLLSYQSGINSGSYTFLNLSLKNVAIYGCGRYGVNIGMTNSYFEDVNMGVEVENEDDDIKIIGGNIRGKNIKLGGANGYVDLGTKFLTEIAFENYQNILNNHRTFFVGGYFEYAAISGETPNKKLSDYVIKITPNVSGHEYISELAFCIFEDEWNNVPAGTYSIGYWIFNDSGVTLNSGNPLTNIWLEVEHLVGYDDTSEYVMTKIYSTLQDIADAADADDWDKLVTGNFTTPATSKIRAKIYFSKYLPSTNVFIDYLETEN